MSCPMTLDLNLRKLVNIGKTPKMGGGRAQYPVSLSEIKLQNFGTSGQKLLKNRYQRALVLSSFT